MYFTSTNEKKILAIPSKGEFFKPTIKLLEGNRIQIVDLDSRKIIKNTNNSNLRVALIRSWDILKYMKKFEEMKFGITGLDIIKEQGLSNSNFQINPLGYGAGKISLIAKTKDFNIKSLNGKKIATKFKRITREFLKKENIIAQVISIYEGTLEAALLFNQVEAVVDLVSTGRTIKENKLFIVEELFETQAVLISKISQP